MPPPQPPPAESAAHGIEAPGMASLWSSVGSARARRSTIVRSSGVAIPSVGSGRPARTRSTPTTGESSHA